MTDADTVDGCSCIIFFKLLGDCSLFSVADALVEEGCGSFLHGCSTSARLNLPSLDECLSVMQISVQGRPRCFCLMQTGYAENGALFSLKTLCN